MGDRELESLRRYGFGVAYRMLGSLCEAEDVTQEALLRLARQLATEQALARMRSMISTRSSSPGS